MISLADESIFKVYRQAVEYFDNAIFVELGCFEGASTIYLADQIKKSGKDITVIAIDLWQNIIAETGLPGSIFTQFWQYVIDAGVDRIICPIQADSANSAKLFEDKSVAFCYIDADHTYEGFKRDLLAWLPKLKPGGWIGGHDYNQEVEKVVKDILIDLLHLKVDRYDGDGPISKGCGSWLCKL